MIRRYLYQQVFWRGAALASMFLLNLLFARFLGASGSGLVLYQFTVASFIIRLIGFSLESGLGYFAARKAIPESRLISFSIIWSLISTLLVGCTYLPVSDLLGHQPPFPLHLILAFISGNLLIAFGNAIGFARLAFVFPNLLNAAVQLALTGLLLSLQLQGRAEAFIPFYFYAFLLHGLVLFIWLGLRRRISDSPGPGSSDSWKSLFRYSALAFLANTSTLLLLRIDYVLVRHACTAEELGNYIQVSRVAQLFFLIPSMLATVFFPVAVSDGVAVRMSIARSTKQILRLSLAGSAVLVLTGNWLFPALFGESFNLMYGCFLWLIPGIVALSGHYGYASWFAAKNQQVVNIRASCLGAVVILVLGFWLIPIYGIRGAAAVSSLGYLCCYGYLARMFRTYSCA